MHELESWISSNGTWIGVVTGVLGVVLAFLVPWWLRAPIKPSWQLRSQTPLLMAGSNSPLVTVSNRAGVEAKHPFLSVIRFGNRGKGEIKGEAYDGPVRVKFPGSRIVGAAIHDRLGIQTETVLTIDDKVLTFKPFLLRKDEWFEVQVLTDGRPEMPDLKVRVAGHKAEVEEMTRKRYEYWQLVQFMSGAVALVMLFMGTTAGSEGAKLINFTAFWLAFAVFGVANYRKSKQPRWKNEPAE